jgi:hypothetical protein
MLPHPLKKRIISRVFFYTGVAIIAILMRVVTPEQNAEEGVESYTDAEPAKAYYAFPPAQ